MKPITIIVADDQMLTREGLRTILDLEEDMAVVGTATNGQEACELVEQLRPDLVLMDIRMPVMNGIDALKRIRMSCPETAVLILTTFLDDEYIIEGMASGAKGYILKDMEGDKMIASIRDTASGQFVLPSVVAAKLAAKLNEVTSNFEQWQSFSKSQVGHVKLTEREKEVAALIIRGLSNREIAEVLHVAEGTARNYISNLYGKMEVSDRAQAIIRLQDLL
ncbi:response regulator transcription factor [Paenibacillus radicis (ex Gao et al. 2016)]|uniref:DNA-binding response regulator n=1 Tax=Paenibacillus radicis (ex Gao et al. 2016) TaxID=1737354 RepID=A0A917LYJ8_9BACL|nr:response regulator transcription factor [Paenibacillus radicis (ex Gao et al. 2016)]GGG67243.1 DNA-binding response regulator [Paenibacillus radicis (ex Gao et al. 2016)]